MTVKHRSKFEGKVADTLGEAATYESAKFSYVVPESYHTYTPDFHIVGTNVYLELKGRLLPQERKKYLLVQKQHPEIRLVFVFMNENMGLTKKSKTTYKLWAEKNGFEVVHPAQLKRFVDKEASAHK